MRNVGGGSDNTVQRDGVRMVCAQNGGKLVVGAIAGFEHVSSEVNGCRVLLVLIQQDEELMGIVVAGSDTIRRRLGSLVWLRDEQHGVFRNFV
jgi:hypothetical protein